MDGQTRGPGDARLDADPGVTEALLLENLRQHPGRVLVTTKGEDAGHPRRQVGPAEVGLRNEEADLALRRDDHALVVIDVEVLVAREVEHARRLMDEHDIEMGVTHELP